MIIDYPCSLNKENLGIRVKGFDYLESKPKSQIINPREEKEIILNYPTTISTEIFKLSPNLTVSIFSKGKPLNFIVPFNNLPKILKNEGLFSNLSKHKRKKLRWVFCKAVCSSRINVLSRLNETRKNIIVKEMLEEMRKLDKSLIKLKKRTELMGVEGNVAKLFYHALSELNEDFDSEFRKRDRNSRDIINSSMNFCHTILRNRISQRLILNGINPYHSFLHDNKRNQQYLTFDFAEFWIAYADKLIFYALERKIIKKTDISKSGLLKLEAKNKLIRLITSRITNEDIDKKIKEFVGYLGNKNKISWKV